MAALNSQDAQRFLVIAYMNVASLALLIYDYVLTLSSEVELVWTSKSSLIKTLFFLTRYIPFIYVPLMITFDHLGDPSTSKCGVIEIMVSAFLMLGVIIAQVILTVRTWALWNRQRQLSIALPTAIVVLVVTLALCVGLAIPGFSYASVKEGAYRSGCVIVEANIWSGIAFACILAYEIVLLVITFISGLRHYHTSGTDMQSLARVAYRDGVLFYVYLACLSTVNIVIGTAVTPELNRGFATMECVMHAMLSSRVVLHLRAAAASSDEAATLVQIELSAMQSAPVFARHHGGSSASLSPPSRENLRSSHV